MHKYIITTISIIALILSSSLLFSVEGNGQGGAFLKIPVGARPAGMGDAFTAISNDVNAMYFNPGGLYQINDVTLGGMYSLMSLDRKHYQLSFIYPKEPTIGTFGLMVTGFGISDIDGRDYQGNPTGKFSDSEVAVNLGYGKNIAKYLPMVGVPVIFKSLYFLDYYLGIGTNVKYIYNSLEDNKATGYGFDFGIHGKCVNNYNYISSLFQSASFGVSFSNLKSQLKWDTDSSHKDEIPFTMRSGISLNFKLSNNIDLLLAADGSKTKDETFKKHIGIESSIYKFSKGGNITLRAGLDNKKMNFGFSIRYLKYQFDYAFCPDVLDEGANNKIGIQMEFK